MPASRGRARGSSWSTQRGMPARSGRRRRAARGPCRCRWMTSKRKPSTPRSSQKRRTSWMPSTTSGFSQSRSGCSGRNRWRYHRPVVVVAGPRRLGRWVREGPGPVVGRLGAVGTAPVAPHVAVGVVVEPGVLDRGVVRDHVEEHPEAGVVGGVDELLGVVRGCRRSGRRRSGRRRRSRSRPWGSGRSATARARRRRATAGGRGGRGRRRGRRSRRRRRRRRNGGRSGR